jgi:urea transport system substrate-binding protein
VFGGWTSASRKAMLPVVEGADGLLFYPVQYEGLEASKNIYYTGATTNQQIIPAMDFLKSEGVETLFLAGSDYVFPRTANKIIKQYAKELGIEIVGEEYVPLDSDDWTTQVAKIAAASPTSCSTRSMAPRTWASSRPITRRASARTTRPSSRCPSPRKRRRPWVRT